MEKAIPDMKGKLHGMSYRVPTNIICGSDISIKVTNCDKNSY